MFALKQNLDVEVISYCQKKAFINTSFKGFALHLMNAALDMARTLNVPAITGLFGNGKLQTIAKFIGMTVTLITSSKSSSF